MKIKFKDLSRQGKHIFIAMVRYIYTIIHPILILFSMESSEEVRSPAVSHSHLGKLAQHLDGSCSQRLLHLGGDEDSTAEGPIVEEKFHSRVVKRLVVPLEAGQVASVAPPSFSFGRAVGSSVLLELLM